MQDQAYSTAGSGSTHPAGGSADPPAEVRRAFWDAWQAAVAEPSYRQRQRAATVILSGSALSLIPAGQPRNALVVSERRDIPVPQPGGTAPRAHLITRLWLIGTEEHRAVTGWRNWPVPHEFDVWGPKADYFAKWYGAGPLYAREVRIRIRPIGCPLYAVIAIRGPATEAFLLRNPSPPYPVLIQTRIGGGGKRLAEPEAPIAAARRALQELLGILARTGRPPGSGTYADRAAFHAAVRRAIRAIPRSRNSGRVTHRMVYEQMYIAGTTYKGYRKDYPFKLDAFVREVRGE